jgi:hypothetical protein
MSNTEKLNNWLSLGANIGVLIGLFLLVVELDQNSDAVRAQIHQSRSDNFESFHADMANSELLVEALVKFRAAGGAQDLTSIEQLSPEELARVRYYHRGRLMGYDNLYFQYKSGFLEEDFYNVRVVNPVRALAPLWTELGLLRLGHENPFVTTSFAEEIERILSIE